MSHHDESSLEKARWDLKIDMGKVEERRQRRRSKENDSQLWGSNEI